jgi:hypothetical protein
MNPVRPKPIPGGVVRHFTRGKERPRGVVWFGAGSFWGHLRHLISAAVAAENVDSRDWMTPDEPDDLRARIVETLGGDPTRPTLTEALGRDLYIDFVADTGDDVAVSRAVARLVFSVYELPDPDRPGQLLTAPRGDILFFGGDTAYPVATAREILNRIIVPWNQVLQALPDGNGHGRSRVLLGIPGNHDWYDGLDGFARMFRRRTAGPRAPAPALSPMMRQQYTEWARELLRGGVVAKPEALVLSGYTPVQGASHFALRLAPGIELLAVDRQLTRIDPRQQEFLGGVYQERPDAATMVVLPDPVFLFGMPSKTGTEMIESLHLDPAARETFVLTGDIHHYERFQRGKALHVIAGGGGAFLHPARIAPGGITPDVAWPGAAQSRQLLRHVPWKLACGRSGLLPHITLLLLFAPGVALDGHLYAKAHVSIPATLVITVLLAIVFALIAGAPRQKAGVPLAVVAAAAVAAIPIGVSFAVRATLPHLTQWAPTPVILLVTLALAAFAGTFVFGAFLALLTALGYEHLQALTALDHPGFKHFVRLRVRADGRGIDAWCIGATNPLGPGQQPELVDHFVWRPHNGRGS